MIISFKCKDTEAIFNGEKTKKFSKAIVNIGKRKLDMIEHAHNEQDLRVPPSNHFEPLKGDLKGFYSIRINKQFRIVFCYENGDAYDLYITDYHK